MSKENSFNSERIPSSTNLEIGKAIAVKKIYTHVLLAVTL